MGEDTQEEDEWEKLKIMVWHGMVSAAAALQRAQASRWLRRQALTPAAPHVPQVYTTTGRPMGARDAECDSFAGNIVMISLCFILLVIVTVYTGGWVRAPPLGLPAHMGCLQAGFANWRSHTVPPAPTRAAAANTAANITAYRLTSSISGLQDLPGKRVGTYNLCECACQECAHW